MYGWVGRILRIDLARGDFAIEELDPDLARDYIGGRGLGSKILFDEVDPNVDPLSPENKLIISAGPLTGTGATSGSRLWVVAKSPQTGTTTHSSVGGYIAAEMRFAGYDVIIIEGKAAKPVYVAINDDDIQFKPAEHLWGKDTWETEELIKKEIGDSWKARETQMLYIGPAGENLAKFAAIVHDKHTVAGRGATGAVMGSKNLKAITVRGTKAIQVADGQKFRETVLAILNKWKKDDGISYFSYTGSAAAVAGNSKRGCLPVLNYQRGTFEGVESLNWKVQKTLLSSRSSCFGCPCHCRPEYKLPTSKPGELHVGLEYETVALLGSNCGISDYTAVIKSNDICNSLGMDAMSAGSTIALAMELFERGYVTEQQTGLKLNFGNAEAMLEALRRAARREGFGNELAEGGYALANKYGHPELFVGVKKLEMPAYDPRRLQGMGLNLATANRGACHNRAYTPAYEAFASPDRLMDPAQTKGKAAMVRQLQDAVTALDSAGLCLFPQAAMMPPFQMDDVVAQLEAATGAGYTVDNFMLIGERIWNLERIYNLKAGFTKADDMLPPRMLKEPLPDGPGKGQVCRLDEMLPEYYKLRGWDENGVPTSDKLSELGLEGLL